jgi:hypothetical protein
MKLRTTLVAATTLALASAWPAVARIVSPVKKSATYTGRTVQGRVCAQGTSTTALCNVSVKTSANGRKVTQLFIRFRAPCPGNRFFRSDTVFTGLSIVSNKINKAAIYNEKVGDQANVQNTVGLHATFKRSSKGKYSISGTYSVFSQIFYTSGGTLTCEAKAFKWSAKV